MTATRAPKHASDGTPLVPGVREYAPGKYIAEHWGPNRSRDRKTFTSADKANEWKSGRNAVNAASGSHRIIAPESAGAVSTDVVYAMWQESRRASGRKSESAVRTENYHWRNHCSDIAATPIRAVSAFQLDRLGIELRDKGLAENTRARIIRIVSGVMRYAVKKDLRPDNPVEKMDARPVEYVPEGRAITLDELGKLVDAAPTPRDAAMFLLLQFGTMRVSELLGLNVENVDLDGCTVSTAWQWNRQENARTLKKTQRAREGRPVREHRAAFPAWLAPLLADVIDGRPGDAPLFVGPRGARVNYNNWRSRVFVPAVDAAGLAGDDAPTIHSFRHGGATMLGELGADADVIRRTLDHTHARTTERYIQRADTTSQVAALYGNVTSLADRRRKAV
jgi:integrase